MHRFGLPDAVCQFCERRLYRIGDAVGNVDCCHRTRRRMMRPAHHAAIAQVHADPTESAAPPLAKPDAPGARISQTFIVLNPGALAGEGWPNRIASIADAISSQPGARLPGDRRIRARQKANREGLAVTEALLAKLRSLAGLTTSKDA